MQTDQGRYEGWMLEKAKEWEAFCTRCGACCGSLDDPCENLRLGPDDTYQCVVYDRCFGKWLTVSGKELNCVPIRHKIAQGHSWPGDEHCGYRIKSSC